jgi:hypothetical protein
MRMIGIDAVILTVGLIEALRDKKVLDWIFLHLHLIWNFPFYLR